METDIVGVENYLQLSDERPDLFVADEGFYHFPCGECQHKKREREYCEGDVRWVVVIFRSSKNTSTLLKGMRT